MPYRRKNGGKLPAHKGGQGSAGRTVGCAGCAATTASTMAPTSTTITHATSTPTVLPSPALLLRDEARDHLVRLHGQHFLPVPQFGVQVVGHPERPAVRIGQL